MVLGLLIYAQQFMSRSDAHLQPLRLLDVARNRGPQLINKERDHLRGCKECQWVLEVFVRQFSKPPLNKPKDAA
jgi:hypothetical protein